MLYSWNEEKMSFIPTVQKMRISGHTTELLSGIVIFFLDCGNSTRFLQNFVDSTYAGSKFPGQVALADAVSTLLASLQAHLNDAASKQRSLLQLQALFRPANSVLTCFRRIVANVSGTRSDESMLSIVFEEIQLLEHRPSSLKEILIEVLSRVSRPWLEFMGEWVGLERETGLSLTKEGTRKSFVNIEDRYWVDGQGLEQHEKDFVLDYDKVPSFISPEDARSIFEVGRSFRLVREHHRNHPLARPDIIASAVPPTLQWEFSWGDIVQVEAKALQYEKDLSAAIQQMSRESTKPSGLQSQQPSLSSKSELNYFGQHEAGMKEHILASIDLFNQPLPANILPDALSSILDTYLSLGGQTVEDGESLFSPPTSLIPSLSFNPIISAQARIVNGTCMRMFFMSHRLRDHISIQRSFHLLGNGVFSSRLSHALFDPELETAERQRGVARSGGIMGLRLSGRETWPPASSELRLALMGVLTESYVSSQPLNKSQSNGYTSRQASLPGDLSFGVRDLSEGEMEKCMDADSIEALDFLRLSYKPPAPLEAVITPVILYKYDQLFKLLLRVIRVLYVVSALHRDAKNRKSNWQGVDCISQRFRIEALHFVSSISSYFFDTGIEVTWRIFEHKLDRIEDRIKADDNVSLGYNEGLDKLRDYHERVLDRIMFALLLRKRQQPVMQLLEEIFALVLQFAKQSRKRAADLDVDGGANDDVRNLYKSFHKKVGIFITVCGGLSEKKGYGDRHPTQGSGPGELFDIGDLGEENTIAQLLTKLGMSNFYSSSITV
jgi:hypothetical protein